MKSLVRMLLLVGGGHRPCRLRRRPEDHCRLRPQCKLYGVSQLRLLPATGHGPGRVRIADHADAEGGRAAGNGIARLHVCGIRRRPAGQLQCPPGAEDRRQADPGTYADVLRLPARLSTAAGVAPSTRPMSISTWKARSTSTWSMRSASNWCGKAWPWAASPRRPRKIARPRSVGRWLRSLRSIHSGPAVEAQTSGLNGRPPCNVRDSLPPWFLEWLHQRLLLDARARNPSKALLSHPLNLPRRQPPPLPLTRRACSSATPICTRRYRWMPAPPAPSCCRRTRIASPRDRRSPAPAARRRNWIAPLDFLVVSDHSDQMGLITDLQAGKPELLGKPAGQTAGTTRCRQGKAAKPAMEHRHDVRTGQVPQGDHVQPGYAGLSGYLEQHHQGCGRRERARQIHRVHRIRMDLAGHGEQPASQCHLPRQRRQGQPGRAVHAITRRAAPIRAICGSGWPNTNARPAARCWRSRTTAISATARCFR